MGRKSKYLLKAARAHRRYETRGERGITFGLSTDSENCHSGVDDCQQSFMADKAGAASVTIIPTNILHELRKVAGVPGIIFAILNLKLYSVSQIFSFHLSYLQCVSPRRVAADCRITPLLYLIGKHCQS